VRVLLINYHYFVHGGPDRYLFNIKQLLENSGHTVVPFSFSYDETESNDYIQYFPEPISGKGTFLLSKLSLSGKQKFRYMVKMFHNREVEKRFVELLRAEKPDIIYSIYLSSSMLPKILHIAKKEFNIPVVYRLSDFHMFCPSYLFYRRGAVCRECLDSLFSAVRHKCVKASALASVLRVLQISMIRKRRWYDSVDSFVCPSRIMVSCLQEVGIGQDRICRLPTFAVDHRDARRDSAPYILYFGNLTPEKGVEVLIRAFNHVQDPRLPLVLVGYCDKPYLEYLSSLVDEGHKAMVIFKGPLHGDDVWEAIRNCAFVVQPAMCLENMPNALIEALSAGRPVLASAIGSLVELVDDGVNGLLVKPGDISALTRGLEKMLGDMDLDEMGRNARRRFIENHTAAAHLQKLTTLFESLCGASREIQF